MTTNRKKEVFNHGVKPGGKSVHAGVLQKIGVDTKRQVKADRTIRIVARCRQGDHSAFRELFDEYLGSVHRHLSLLIGPGSNVDDLVQLVFLNVFNSVGRFKGESAFSTWLFRITVNVARQEIRLKNRYRRLGQAVYDASKIRSQMIEYTPERRLDAEQQIYGVLSKLSAKKRESFILYTYEGYSLEEIAELLGSSVSTIGSRLQSARKEIISILAFRRKK
jgi:RNA polymerase sigma-70 factor (ECF subfamily)